MTLVMYHAELNDLLCVEEFNYNFQMHGWELEENGWEVIGTL